MDLVQKPWGSEKILVQNDIYVVKEIYVKPGGKLSLQYHDKKVESMSLVSGKGYLYTRKPTYSGKTKMRPFKSYNIPAGTIHRLEAGSAEACVVIEVSTVELDDVVRLEDVYGRCQI